MNTKKDIDILYEYTYDWNLAETLESLIHELNWNAEAIIKYYEELDFNQAETLEEFVVEKIKTGEVIGNVPKELLPYLDYDKIYDEFFYEKYHITGPGFVRRIDEIYQGVLND